MKGKYPSGKNVITQRTVATELSRRRFVQGLLGSGVLSASTSVFGNALADASKRPETMTGKSFDLVIEQRMVNFTGVPRRATAINGSIPGPTLRWREGDEVTLNVTNRLQQTTSLHWHGMILPFQMDGVPGISFPGIAPGETFQYRFTVQQSGTYWYHSHSAFQEMTGMYGAIVIEPAGHSGRSGAFDHAVRMDR